LVRRPLLWLVLVGGAVAMAFVMVLFVAVAADQDARADDGLSGVVCAPRVRRVRRWRVLWVGG
jgi:hypothetical protein